jgi:hypothetical protein
MRGKDGVRIPVCRRGSRSRRVGCESSPQGADVRKREGVSRCPCNTNGFPSRSGQAEASS